jgi:hypothetical protein
VTKVIEERRSSSATNHASDTSSSTRDTDDYVVELRAPRRKNKKKRPSKRFQLRLKHASSSEEESDGSMSDKSILQSPPPPPPPPAAEDSCTLDNWKSFFSYTRIDNRTGMAVVINPEEFEQKQAPISATNLNLRKYNNNQIGVEIASPYLQKQFRRVVKIEHYSGVFLRASAIQITGEFMPLYHHIDDMKANVAADNEATPSDRAHMDALYYFSKVGLPAKSHEDARNNISQGLITYNELWALFKPGDFAVWKNNIGNFAIRRISSVKLEETDRYRQSQSQWSVSLFDIVWTGSQFKKTSYRKLIPVFAGAKKITDLDFYPLSHHESRDELKEAAIRRGKAWKRWCEGEPRVMSYQGQALSTLVERPPPGSDNTPDQKPFSASRRPSYSMLYSDVS